MNESKNVPYPVFLRHHGTWEGTYTLIDAKSGVILDHHRSRLTCVTNGIDSYHQQNLYAWDDGREEVKEFPGEFEGGWLRFNNPRLRGQSCEVDPNTIFLTWVYKDQPNDFYSEIITLVSDTHRSRTWQHFENGEFTKLTIIDERKVG
ncbi:MAG TPA: DUF3598 family protein [Pyrinomonadaceae bacterium]|nr:DUF3598 family protein [Pyrinomonadaceae bacterium]